MSKTLGLPVLNLAFAGASPEFYVRHHADGLRHWLAGAAFAVVETMSSRSVSNSRFQSVDGRRSAIDLKHPDKPPTNMMTALRRMQQKGKKPVLARLIGESLDAHETLFDELVALSAAPLIGLYLSRRSPDAVDRNRLARDDNMLAQALGAHPHFADRALVGRLAAKCAGFVEVISQRGQPCAALNRFTGEPDTWWNGNPVQSYYPSREMHEDAAKALLAAIGALRGGR